MFQSIYKCRLCKKKIIEDIPEHAEIRVHGILGCEHDQEIYRHMYVDSLGQTTLHNCKDGSLGFVDFCGFKKVEG